MTTSDLLRPVRRALLSVSEKTDLLPFARSLRDLGIELISTGGTARLLSENHIAVTEVSDVTGFPEMMDGRVKTLHPLIHGGILGRRDQDTEVMQAHGIAPIDLIVVNLYPFAQTVARPDCPLEDAIENIDIGGPTMIRAAAKNHRDVAVIVSRDDYATVLECLSLHGGLSAEHRFKLAVKAFEHTAAYDAAIANYLGTILPDGQKTLFPSTFNLSLIRSQALRYGENPHQQAAFYVEQSPPLASVAQAHQLQGKELSYNNIADTDAALECVKAFDAPACVIVKHANPCGVALGINTLEAYERAYQTDPTSAFGGIIAFNRPVNAATTRTILDRQFVEVLIAPAIDPEALALCRQKPNIRVMACGEIGSPTTGWDFKRVNGGLLVQERDSAIIGADALRIVSRRHPDARQIEDMLFAFTVVKFVKSNAIVYANAQQTIGIGAGQMSRVYSAKIAGIKASDEGLTVPGCVMASDAFFPFRDSVDTAANAGISAIIQPGGSIRDAEVIAAADEHNIVMAFTDVRHFRH